MCCWIAVLLAVVTMPSATTSQDPAPSEVLPGYWRGALVRDSSVLFTDLELSAGESLSAHLTIEEWGLVHSPVPCTVEGTTVTTNFMGAPVELLLDACSAELRGSIDLGPDGTCAIHFKRMPHAPEPFFREEQVSFFSSDAELAGSLVLPMGEGPFPAVVLVAGRSYGRRTGMMPFAVLAARHGVAALAFDGRGRGDSEGDALATTSRDRLDDVLAGFELLASDDRIDAEQIGLLGESTGGWIIPEVALENPEVAFLIFIVGPAGSLVTQQGEVIRYLMAWSDEEYSDEELDAAEDYQRRLTEHLIARGSVEDWRPEMERARATRWSKWVDQPSSFAGPDFPFYWNQPYDNTEALRQTTIPVLAIYGGADFVVPPPANVPRLRRWLTEAGNEDFQILTFPGANHDVFLPDGHRGEGEFPERYFRWSRPAPGYYRALADWLVAHVE